MSEYPGGQPQRPYEHQQQPIQVNNHIVVVNQKNTLVAYVLWFFLGQLGIHKFYLGQVVAGIVYLALGIIGWATTFILIGWVPLGVLWVLLIIDIFTIPGTVARINQRGAERYTY
ncbi:MULTISPECIES: TM2 domain-containing protein [Glutamicibacter]|uniref:TM2 domain-containing protein n=1 Tax=Glutamicibacter TaxID=1742989 RepID=UPI000EDCA5C2|nr:MULTISPECIES: TM2 domain-containing protein [unclassified Glutamicibacter]UXN31831.1 TM2 domain-containing protein [Glutamicibacter sp. M10]HCJ53522.1 TM2 domain-containing protein [Glutamicibacter sp.]